MNPNVLRLQTEKTRLENEIRRLETAGSHGKPLTETEQDQAAALRWKLQLTCDSQARLHAVLDEAARHAGPPERAFTVVGPSQPHYSGPQQVPNLSRGAAWAQAKFGLSQAGPSEFSGLGEFLATIQSGLLDSRLSVLAAGQTEGSGSSGGFLVPEELSVALLGPAYEASVILQRAKVVPMLSDEKKIAGWDTSSASGGVLFGGFEPQVLSEGQSMTTQAGQVRSIKLHARKIGLLAKSSNELVDDSSSIPALLQDGLSAALGFTIDYFCLRGTGAGQPLGILNAPSRISVTKEPGQAAGTITYANLVTMFSRLHPTCYASSVWLAHPSTIPSLEQLTIPVGTSGAVYRVISDGNGSPEILHRPVIFTEKASSLGSEGDVVLLDLSQYVIGLRTEITIEQSRHVYFASDESAWRAIIRLDGQPLWASVYCPISGPTMSWCVVLATRS